MAPWRHMGPPISAPARARLFLNRYWRFVAVVSYVLVNVILTVGAVTVGPEAAQDWAIFRSLDPANLYAQPESIPFVWSPPAGWLMVGVVQIGYWPWLAAHIAVLLLLRSPLLVALVLASYGFWFDATQGNTLTFSLVAGMLALGGSRWASLAYLALFVLMPRPLLIPLAIWLLWKRPELRWPFVGMVGVVGALTIASKQAVEWLTTMLAYRGPDFTFGVTDLLGPFWLIVGVPMAAWLTWKGRVGWAGILVSPYVLPQYIVWPLTELTTTRGISTRSHRIVQRH